MLDSKPNYSQENYTEFMYNLDDVQPMYEKISGWDCDIKGTNSFEGLPLNAKKYIEYLEMLLKIGADKSFVHARKTLSKVYRKVGFLSKK